MAVDELGQVGGRGGDEGVCQVRREQRRLAAEGGDCRATCKVSATQEQRNSPLPEVTIITTVKGLILCAKHTVIYFTYVTEDDSTKSIKNSAARALFNL